MARRELAPMLVCAFAAVLASAPCGLADVFVARPPVTWSPAGSGSNFTPMLHRRIDCIVVHATEGGSLIGNVSWLAGDTSESSAHYVVSRDGHIVQLVPLHDVAWHAGNRQVNLHSIGIEHIGETFGPDGFTRVEYRASARLVAWLVRRYGIPLDRRHIIGHSEVPDPFHPDLSGGTDHHRDPGPHWKWRYYMHLVRRFAFPSTLKVTTTIDTGTTVSGIVRWRAETTGAHAARVDFLVDGRVVWSDARPPFAFAGGRGLNTTTLANGTHVLLVRARGSGDRAARRVVVVVANRVFALTTSAIHPWERVAGTLRVRAKPSGARTTGVGLYVDGRAVSRDRSAPYGLRWDTRRVHDGRHRVALIATSDDGRVAARRLPLVVSNHPVRRQPKPRPKPSAPPQITAANISDGQTVSGVVDWRVHTIGPVARVEFQVDGTVIATEKSGPWATAWDATTATAGAHVLEVKASTRDGRNAVRTTNVVVASPAPQP